MQASVVVDNKQAIVVANTQAMEVDKLVFVIRNKGDLAECRQEQAAYKEQVKAIDEQCS